VAQLPDEPRRLIAAPHLRRDGEEVTVTTVELFFDLVYVFAITQLSHLVLGQLDATGALRAAFLLVVVWWGWIYATWTVNWFDPESDAVRGVLVFSMLASLLMAAAVPEAFGARGLLFALGYVALQVGRNAAATVLLVHDHPLRAVYERITAWSIASGVLWIAGGLADPGVRMLFWGPALLVDLAAPLAGYRVPGLGRSDTEDYVVDGGHFAERCQGFILIALGESIVVTGATATGAGLGTSAVLALAVTFLGTAALWWLYFGEVARHSRRLMAESVNAGALARDAYTYLHVPIIAGVIAVAVGDELVIAHPGDPLETAGALAVLGGPALFLLGENFFRVRMIGSANVKRLVAVAVLAALGLVAAHVSALALAAAAVVVLVALARWEGLGRGTTRRPEAVPRGASGEEAYPSSSASSR
jgi:low temperature requirement protein LtrA